MRYWRNLRNLAAGALLASGAWGCRSDTPAGPGAPTDRWSFETGLGAWRGIATDTGTTDGAHAPWSITVSQERSSHGAWSAKLTADNHTDAVKLWVEREYAVTANRSYDVTVAFDFGTADFGVVNLWRLMAGALPYTPRTAQGLEPVFREETDGGESPGLYRWHRKEYTSRVQSDGSGKLYVVVGVWGTYEVLRTYFIDDVRVTITSSP